MNILKMNKKRKLTCYLIVSMVLLVSISISCVNKSEDNENTKFNEFETPKTFPLKFSEEKPFKWNVTDLDTLPAPKTSYLNFDALPSEPFEMNSYKPLKTPMTTVDLDLDSIKTTFINLDTLESLPFKPRISVLTPPVITQVEVPSVLNSSSLGILNFTGLETTGSYSAFIDDKNNKWFGTDQGLVKIDGETMETYANYRRVSAITQDKEGRIWLGNSSNGIVILDIKNGLQLNLSIEGVFSDMLCDYEGNMWLVQGDFPEGALYKISADFNSITTIVFPEKLDTKSISLKEDGNHNLWIGQHHSISMLDSSRTRLKTFGAAEGLDLKYVLSLFIDSQGELWFGSVSNRNFYGLSIKNKTLKSLIFETSANLEMSEDPEGKLWIMGDNFIYNLNKDKTQMMTIPIDVTFYNSALSGSILDEDGNIWLTSVNQGLLILDTEAPFTEHFNKKLGLVNDNVWALHEDSENNVWIGTHDGINIYNPKTQQLKKLTKKEGYQKNRIDGNRRTSDILEIEKNKVAIAGEGGLYILDKDKHSLVNYGTEQGFQYGGDLKLGKKNEFWIGFGGSDGRQIGLFDFKNDIYKTIDESIDLTNDYSYSLVTDKKGNIWVSTSHGVSIINPETNTYKTLTAKNGLVSNEVLTLELNTDGEIYVGTRTGVSIINLNDSTIINLKEAEGLIPEMVFDFISADSTIYAGTQDGLIEINKPTDENQNWVLNNFNVQKGMPNTDFHLDMGVRLKNGELWMGASGGLTPNLTVLRSKPKVKKTPPVASITGLQIMDKATSFKKNERYLKYLSKSDTIWLENNRDYYTESTLPEDSDYLSANNIKWDSTYGKYGLPANLELPYSQNVLKFYLNNNSVIGRKRVVYKYFLEGSDTEWQLGGATPESKNYYNLNPGGYTFKVISKDINNVWSEPAEFSFTILPPWWRTWWAYLLIGLIVLGLLRVYIVFRGRKLTKENKTLEEKVNHRTKELEKSIVNLKSTQALLVQSEKMASLGELTAGIAHEIQNPLNFVNNFSEVSEELIVELKEELEKGDIEEAKAISVDVIQNLSKINHHGKRASSIVKGMLEHSRNSSGEKELTDINALADEYLRLAYHGLRAKDKSFNAELVTDFETNVPRVNVVSQDIGRVLLNIITNAFHATSERNTLKEEGYKPTVSVSSQHTADDRVLIAIKDNGSGIPDAIKEKIFQPFFTTKDTGNGTGLGLSLAYDIVKAHNGELKVISEAGKGTEFIIELPYV